MSKRNLTNILDTKKFNIIDGHCHIGKLNTFNIQGGMMDDFVRVMDKVGIAKAAIAPHLGLKLDVKRSNDYIAECMKKYPDRFIGMATINPNRPKEIIGELERCFDNLQCSVIKLHPDFFKAPMNRPDYQLIYDFAAERSLPILNHDWQSPDRLKELATIYPQIRFIQAHNAGNWDGHSEDEYFVIAKDLPNVYVDICASPISYKSVEKLVKKIGPDKIIFGSDAPFLNLAFGVGKVLFANITDQEKQMIFADNYLNFLYGKAI